MDYQKKFDEMLAALKSCQGVTVTAGDFYSKEEIIPSFFKKYSTLKSIENDIKVLNDNKIVWVYDQESGSPFPMGETHLISIEEVIAVKQKLKNGAGNEKEKKILSELMPFDDHPDAGDGMMGCLRLNKDRYEVWFCNKNLECFKMNLELAGYLEKLIHLKAIYGWQYLFADLDIKNPAFNIARKELKNRLSILLKCFPDNSLNAYLQKL